MSQQSNANNSLARTPLGFQMLSEEQRRDLLLESFEEDYLKYFCELEDVPQDKILMMIKGEQMHCQEKSQDVEAEKQQVSVSNGTSANFVKGEEDDLPSRNTQEVVEDENKGHDFYFYESESDDMDL